MIRTSILRTTSIGASASQTLCQATSGKVIGITSKGWFIEIAPGSILFLSREPDRGPLTINLSQPFHPLGALHLHDPVNASVTGIEFPHLHTSIQIDRRQIWEPIVPDIAPVSQKERLAAFKSVAHTLLNTKNGQGFTPLLAFLYDFPDPRPALNPELVSLFTRISNIQAHLAKRDLTGLYQTLTPLIGYGSGLTPSGDDLAAGVFLALARWGRLIHWNPATLSTLRSFPASVANQTTALSLRLLECAAQGTADERLITALDGLVTGNALRETCSGLLAAWGNSSGADAFLGMSLVFVPPKSFGAESLPALQ